MAVGLGAAGFLPRGLLPSLPVVTLAATALVILGSAMVLFGTARYVRAYQHIETADYMPTVWPIVAIGVLVAIIALLAAPLVLALR